MPGIEILENKLFLFLGGLVILLILLFLAIKHSRKLYWDTTGLSKRKRETQRRKRTRIVLIIAGTTTFAATILLTLTVHGIVAIIFAVLSTLAIVIFVSPYGSRGGQGSSGSGD